MVGAAVEMEAGAETRVVAYASREAVQDATIATPSGAVLEVARWARVVEVRAVVRAGAPRLR